MSRSLSRVALVGAFAFGAFGGFGAASGLAQIPGPRATAKPLPRGVAIELHNPHPGEMTVKVEWKLVNMTATAKEPVTCVLKPGESREAVRFFAGDPTQKWRYDYTYHHTWGTPEAKHDANLLYYLPYPAKRRFVVLQGPGGKFSHLGDNQHAVDFDVPVRTPVCAARAGKVILALDQFTETKLEPEYKTKANLIYIRHDDATVAEYVHLAARSFKVKPGDDVAAGQLLGLSGNTGYSSQPHLHFMVFRGKDGKDRESLPVRFISGEGRGITMEQGRAYTATAPSP